MEMDALSRLVHYSRNFMIEFNAAELITINKTVIFSVMANVAMYLIIVFQVDQSQYQRLVFNENVCNCSV